MIPANVRPTGTPGAQGCDGFHSWVHANHGVDTGRSQLQVVVQGKVPDAVLISAMRVKVLHRGPPLTGIPVVCETQGEAQIRAVSIDLDATPPRVIYDAGAKPFAFTISNGETETFNILASTRRAHYRWTLELDVIVNGTKRTIEVRDKGGPFETSADSSRGYWSWDYQDTWILGWNPERAGRPAGLKVPATVRVGTPLPPLP
jgi:hypothetical protein